MQLRSPLDQTHIPHAGSMCLLDEVVSWDASRIECKSLHAIAMLTIHCARTGDSAAPAGSNMRRKRWRCTARSSPDTASKPATGYLPASAHRAARRPTR